MSFVAHSDYLGAVGLGLVLRLYRYFLNTPVWRDELWILRNIVHKSFRELLGPLDAAQAAPPLFLWLERALFLCLGPSAMVMRLVPVLASCVALILMVPLGAGV